MKRISSISVLLSSLLAAPAVADVTVVRTMSTEGFSGFGGGERLFTTWIASDRERKEYKTKSKPSMLEKMGGVDKPEIVRLDMKLRWRLDPSKKSYQETPLVIPGAPTREDDSDKHSKGPAPEKPTARISKAEFKVTPLNQKKRVGEFNCEGYQLRTLLEIEDLENHTKSEMRMVSIFWNAPEQGAVAQLKKEETAYNSALLKAMGIDDAERTQMKLLGTAMVAGMAGAGEKELSKALAGIPNEMKKVKGYPISTRVEWYTQGEDAHGKKMQDDDSHDNVEIPTNMADAAGSLVGGMFKKKMQSKQPAPTADGQLMYASTIEIKSISTSSISRDTFEVPAGFKKTH